MPSLGHMFCLFAFVLVPISLIQGWIVKGTLSVKILALCPQQIAVLWPYKKSPKT